MSALFRPSRDPGKAPLPRRNSSDRRRAERRGRLAEGLAVVVLRLKGYRILVRRYRCRLGEIDIVASRGAVVVAVEVKARRKGETALGEVTAVQCRRIERAANYYFRNHAAHRCANPATSLRFDVIAVGRWGRIRHHIDAWRPQMG